MLFLCVIPTPAPARGKLQWEYGKLAKDWIPAFAEIAPYLIRGMTTYFFRSLYSSITSFPSLYCKQGSGVPLRVDRRGTFRR